MGRGDSGTKTFGLVNSTRYGSRGGRGSHRGRGRGGGGGGANGKGDHRANAANQKSIAEGASKLEHLHDIRVRNETIDRLGFETFDSGPPREGWLVNMSSTSVEEEDSLTSDGLAALDLFFIQEDGAMFKSTITHQPYFYLETKIGMESIVEEFLIKAYEGQVHHITRTRKQDLQQPNHLLGYDRTYLTLHFRSMNDFLAVRRELLPLAQKNKSQMNAIDAYAEVVAHELGSNSKNSEAFSSHHTSATDSVQIESASRNSRKEDPRDCITDIREYDVPHHLRVAIDCGECMSCMDRIVLKRLQISE